MAIKFKEEDGRLMYDANASDGLMLINSFSRFVLDYKVQCMHFVNPIKFESWIVMSRLQTSLLLDKGMEEAFNAYNSTDEIVLSWKCYDRIGGVNQTVRFEKPVILHIKNWRNLRCSMMIDPSGKVMAGSNIYSASFGSKQDHLCLGVEPSPFSPEWVDLLLYAEANKDLEWRGGELQLKRLQVDSGTIYEATSWKTYNPSLPILVPEEVKDACRLLSQS